VSRLASAQRRGENRAIAVLRTVLFWAYVALSVLMVGAMAAGQCDPEQLITVIVGAGYAGVARFLGPRAPENALIPVLGALAVTFVIGGLCDGYRFEGDDERLLQYTAWVGNFAWNLWLVNLAAVALPLLFPDGRPATPRWRWVGYTSAAAVLAGMLGYGLEPGRIEPEHPTLNPLGVTGADALWNALQTASHTLTSVAALGAAASLIVRIRRSRGIERQQLKWFAYVAALILVGFTGAVVTSAIGANDVTVVLGPVFWFTALVAIGFGVPLATTFAVLRHRLYDIDVVIRRTLVYGVLTAILGGAYVGSVLLLQLLLSPSSDLAIAGSTLAVAALFQPARTRIQGLVDRRFYRRAYNAQRTAEAFGARLRDELSLDALTTELRTVVTDTLQPAHVTVWLKR
jgi:hypothetical protein